MKAGQTTLKRLIEGERQYQFPQFQRPYTWEVKQLKELWVGNRLIDQAAFDMITRLSSNQVKHVIEADWWIGTEVTVATGTDPKFSFRSYDLIVGRA